MATTSLNYLVERVEELEQKLEALKSSFDSHKHHFELKMLPFRYDPPREFLKGLMDLVEFKESIDPELLPLTEEERVKVAEALIAKHPEMNRYDGCFFPWVDKRAVGKGHGIEGDTEAPTK